MIHVRHSKVVLFAIVALFPSQSQAGNINGVVQELNGTPIVGATITVRDLATGQRVGTSQSKAGGLYNVSLPDDAAVSVTFVDGIHVPASLVGVSGNVGLNNFAIFMPVRQIPCRTEGYAKRSCFRSYR